jgi:valyl-tRNA synthetase
VIDRTELAKTYEPKDVERRLYDRAERAGVFHEEPDLARPPFIISMPPPNITGRAHLGHGSTYTVQDALTRYHRMRGDNADWLPGQDHAAIATEAVIVRELKKEGLTRDGLGREKFLERAWQWRAEYGGIMYDQFRELGFGPDWERDRFTMDPALSHAVNTAFVRLYNEGLIYRGTRLINWDPTAKSTLSDAEVENEPRDGAIWYVRYRGADGGPGIVVATTRPETIPADVAVAVHPEDERYKALIGTHVLLPLFDRPVPVIADAVVDMTFATGALKITPGHDITDYEIGVRHNLPMPSAIDFDGKLCGDAGAYVGMDRFEAKAAITRDIAAAGLLEKTEPHQMTVPISSRSGDVVEPLLSLQWFCTMQPLAEKALEAHRDGRVRFVPERFGRTYAAGLENIRDWNVSRQVWWGHPLPVWYGPNDEVVVALTEEDARAQAREKFGHENITRDTDTLDTWFSSALWPFSILGWPDMTPEREHWYPNQLLVTGREIIFLWVSRMVMLGIHFAGDVPFRDVFVAPLVFDIHGRKMSKSLGNAIDPLDLIARYGADATRFGIVKQMRLESQELRFDERLCDEARRFANKLWNATRFVCALPEGLPRASTLPPLETLTIADRWILTRLYRTVETVTNAFDAYEFGVAADALLTFGWNLFCDRYLEATKAPSAKATRAAVLAYTLNTFVRLLHPIAPFVSEEIWLALPHDGETIVTASWPDPLQDLAWYDGANGRFERDAADFDSILAAIERSRVAKADKGLGPRDKFEVELPESAPRDKREILAELLKVFVNADVRVSASLAMSATFVNNSGQTDFPAMITIRESPAIARERYLREVAKLEDEVARGEAKLANENFTSRAKPEVVAKEREKLEDYRRQLARMKALLAALDEAP